MEKRSELSSLGASIRDNRLAAGTKRQYGSKERKFLNWVEERYGIVRHPVSTEIIEEYLAHISQKIDQNTGQYYEPRQWNTFSYVGGHCSAIKNMYKSMPLIILPEETKNMMNEYLIGYRRKFTQLKADGEISPTEGKSPLNADTYQYLAMKSLEESSDYSLQIASHAFLLFCWNLMARAVSVNNLLFDHIGERILFI